MQFIRRQVYHREMQPVLTTYAATGFAVTGEDLIKLLLAIVCGGLVGVEREFRDKPAGFRTLIFICMGSTLFTIFSLKIGDASGSDPARIASNIVSGVGFLGAGVILQQRGHLVGLTTAAVIWFAAALGIGIGSGEFGLVAVATVCAMVLLIVFPIFLQRLDRLRDKRIYEVHCDPDHGQMERLEQLFREQGMIILHRRQMKKDGRMVCSWELIGKTESHLLLMEILVNDPQIHEVHV